MILIQKFVIFLFMVLFHFVLVLPFKLNLRKYSRTEQIFQCITKISDEILDVSTLMIFSVWNETGQTWKYSGPMTLLSTQNSENTYQLLNKFDFYLLIFDKVEQFNEWLKEIYLFNFWKPNSKFIVTIFRFDNITEIFEIAWKYYIIDINILWYRNKVVEVYTYFPYNSELCLVNLSTEILFLCSDNIPANIFPEKVPHNFNGCPIKIQGNKVIPYVIDTSANENDPKKTGLEVMIINTLMIKLNLTQVYVKHNYPAWGVKLPNGTFTFMFGELKKRNTDMMIGLAYIDRMNDFDALIYSLMDIVIWWVPSANPLPPWINLFKIFTPIAWIYVFISIFVNAIVWWLFGKGREEVVQFKSLLECVVASFYIILQGSITPPKTRSMKILYIFWVIYSILLFTAYQSQLVSALLKPSFEKQISTLDELLQSNLKLGFYDLMLREFNDPDDPRDKEILKKYIPCRFVRSCVNQTAFRRNIAVLGSVSITKYWIQQYNLYSNGRPMLYSFGPGFGVRARFVINKGYPPAIRLNSVVMLLASNGLINKWEKEVFYIKPYAVEPKLQSLSLAHLSVGFLFLFIGLTASAFSFFLEIVIKKYKTKKHKL